MKRTYFVSILIIPILFIGCKHCNEPAKSIIVSCDTLSKQIIADTIVYDLIIKNTSLTQEWKDQCQQYSELSHFNRNAFIDSIFSGIYDKRYKAFDFFSGKEILPEELLKLEKEQGFSRDGIGKIQFTETWYFDNQNRVFRKKVISMVFGLELLDPSGNVRGYKAILKVYLN